MARRFARRDANQKDVVAELRRRSRLSVADCADVGDGFPDLVVGYNRSNYLFELKDPEKPPSEQQLTPAQMKFFSG